MRPVEFASDQIIKAGQELHAAGRNVTGFALRQKVGGGSPKRLKQVWDERINSQATTKTEPVAELPVEVAEEMATASKALTERLAMLAVELNDRAVKAAERRVHEAVRTAGEQRAQAERELADAEQTVEDLENKLDDAIATAEALEKRLTDSHAANQKQAVELAQVRERLALVEQAGRVSAEQHIAELARLNASNEALGNALDDLRQQHVQMQLANDHLVAEEQKARAVVAEVELRAGELADSLRHEREHTARLEADSHAAHEEAIHVTSRLEQQATKSEQVVANLRRKIEEEENRTRAAHDAATKAAQALAAALAVSDQQKIEIARQAAEIRQLADEVVTKRKEQETGMRSHAATLGECEALRNQVHEQLTIISSFAGKNNTVQAKAGETVAETTKVAKKAK